MTDPSVRFRPTIDKTHDDVFHNEVKLKSGFAQKGSDEKTPNDSRAIEDICKHDIPDDELIETVTGDWALSGCPL